MKRKIEEIKENQKKVKINEKEEEKKSVKIICKHNTGEVSGININTLDLGEDVKIDTISISLMKSAIQKNIRIGDSDSLFQFLDLSLKYISFGMRGNKNQKKHAKGFILTILNKLKVSCVEDIGIGCISTVVKLNHLIIKFLREFEEKDKRSYTITLYKISLLLGSKEIERSRQISFVKQVFYIKFKDKNLLKNEKEYENLNDEVGFYKKFEEKKEFCLYYLFRILDGIIVEKINGEIIEKKEETISNIKKRVIKIINYIIEKNKEIIYRDIFIILRKWFNECITGEYYIYVIQMVLISLYRPIFINININECLLIIETSLLKKKLINLKKIFFDKHVRKIKKYEGIIDESNSFFALKSSIVLNESKLTNQEYKKLYEQHKIALDKK